MEVHLLSVSTAHPMVSPLLLEACFLFFAHYSARYLDPDSSLYGNDVLLSSPQAFAIHGMCCTRSFLLESNGCFFSFLLQGVCVFVGLLLLQNYNMDVYEQTRRTYTLLYPSAVTSIHLLTNILYYTMLYYTILNYTILYYTILHYTILYYTILYYTILHYTILYYTILYYTILYYTTTPY